MSGVQCTRDRRRTTDTPIVLNDEERVVVKAEIDARLQESLRTTDYGAVLAAEGITTVALDTDGNLVEHRPDGSTSIIGHPS